MPSSSFADLGVSPQLAKALRRRDITAPFPVQRACIPDVLTGHDVLVQSPTGSGKTLAFALPTIQRLPGKAKRPAALVLAPTRELASQIVDEAEELAATRNLSMCAVYGGVSIARQSREAASADIVVATPGRLEDLLQRRALTLAHVRVLVLDEADRMLDMGFRPAVDRIVSLTPSSRQTLLFSATLEGEVGRVAKAYTDRPRRHVIAPPPDRRASIEHRFVRVEHAEKLDTLVGELRRPDRGRTLVFVRTKRGADRLVKRLRRHDLDAVGMHGDKSQSQREKALARFEDGEIDTLVATDVAARGIDVAGITHVINFDAPDTRDAYVHRIGRTGRAGARGVGITFVLDDQARDLATIAGQLRLEREFAAHRL
jgi:ATP-dependent RNA helicase RhlE